MNLTAQLKNEHRDIQCMLKILEKICAKIEHGEIIKKVHLESVVEFFSTFVGECHLVKEEMLFPAMEKAGVPKGGGPIGELRAVHTISRSFIGTMNKAILNYPWDINNDKNFTQSAREYIGLLKAHINAEEVLFSLAENYIFPEIKQSLAHTFKQFEKNRFGACGQTKFHKIINRLKTAYL
jgi:hemerythrin-like domain-containing protein